MLTYPHCCIREILLDGSAIARSGDRFMGLDSRYESANPRKGIDVNSRRRRPQAQPTDRRQKKKPSALKGLHTVFPIRPVRSLRGREDTGVNGFRRLHLRLLLWPPFGEPKRSITSTLIPLSSRPKPSPTASTPKDKLPFLGKLVIVFGRRSFEKL